MAPKEKTVGPAAPPTVRRLARELGLAVDDVAGTGPEGQVTDEDVKSHARALLERAREDRRAPEAPRLPDLTRWGDVEREPLSAVRRATARSVARSWERIPQVAQFDRADVTDLEAFRERAEEELSLTAIVVRVAAEALRRFPRLNAHLDAEREELVQAAFVHVGVAVDTERGLLVPAVRDADRKGLAEASRELAELARQAREGRLPRDAMEGATFSVTNLGGLGTTQFTPIVPWPQVAILGMSRATTEAVWRDGAFVPRRVLPLCVVYDHRAVDGADAARFLRWIARALEEPLRLVLDAPSA